jgi:PIN domain nuclease of toxin-antitoxin system
MLDWGAGALDHNVQQAIGTPEAILHASVASLWEMAIKVRLGKLTLGFELDQLPDLLQRMDIVLLAINERHILTVAQPEPRTRDPFDPLLLAQCMVENFRLVTIDRVLKHHRMAWRPTFVSDREDR